MYLKDIIEEIEKLEKQFHEEVNTIMTEIPEADGLKFESWILCYKKTNSIVKRKLERYKTVDEIKNRLQEYINTKTLEVTKDHKILLHDFVLEKLNEIVFKL